MQGVEDKERAKEEEKMRQGEQVRDGDRKLNTEGESKIERDLGNKATLELENESKNMGEVMSGERETEGERGREREAKVTFTNALTLCTLH